MSQADELKLQRRAAADAEPEQGNESGQNRDHAPPTVWRRCLKFLNRSRQFTVLRRDSRAISAYVVYFN